jgi:hypothetical protein
VANFKELQVLKIVVKLILGMQEQIPHRQKHSQPNICLIISYVLVHPNFTSITASENNLTSQKPLNRHLHNKENNGFDLLTTSQNQLKSKNKCPPISQTSRKKGVHMNKIRMMSHQTQQSNTKPNATTRVTNNVGLGFVVSHLLTMIPTTPTKFKDSASFRMLKHPQCTPTFD